MAETPPADIVNSVNKSESNPMSKSTHLLFAAVASFAAAVLPCTAAEDFKALNYDIPAYIDLEFGEIQVDESAGTVSINILRTGEFRQTTTIEYQTSEISASEGRDYKGSGGSITFKPGEGFKTITLELLPDDEAEAPESLLFEITGSSPDTMVGRSSTTITISDSTLVAAASPRLEISASQGQILLAWEGSDRCALERTTDPSTGAWESVACSVTVQGNRCEVLQTMDGRFYFYRLRAP